MCHKTGKKKAEQLSEFLSNENNQSLTTDLGVKIPNTDDSLKAGARGPTLMEDFHFRQKITHFDHERIPERVVHARGFGAHGVFTLYESMQEYTGAKFLQDPAVKTPVFVRFSTVAGNKGSADTVRDVRGFAVKFYTGDGNYDLVGNNIPVFFIQDAIKFPDIIHAVKPEPDNDIPQATSAHDTFWDFVVNTPETAHMVMWVMSDRAIPRSFRMMEGFGVNTFRFVNAKGRGSFVKFHWKPLLGVHSLVRDEAQKLSGKDPDFHRRDLWDAIENGNFPEYELGVQILGEEREFAFDFDILDPTKLWPEELVPVKIIGKITLDKNVNNFFSETEQVAFCPANIVPGIDFSNDPLLQGRLFSYEDTQLTRLGGPNFKEIPINRPVVPVHNNQRGGMHRMKIDIGPVSYTPNSLQGNFPAPVPPEKGGFEHYHEKVDGRVIRERSKSFKDFFGQARMFWNSMSGPEKEHIIDAFHFEVGGAKDKGTRQRVVDMFANVDTGLAMELACRLGVNPPDRAAGEYTGMVSPALSQANTVKTAATRKVALFAADGFCPKTTLPMMEELKKAGVCVEVVAPAMGMLAGSDGTQLEAAKDFVTAGPLVYDAVYVPGGPDSIIALSAGCDARNFINEMFLHKKPIAAANEGADFLAGTDAAAAAQGGQEGAVSSVQGVATIRGAADVLPLAAEFAGLIAMHRCWERK